MRIVFMGTPDIAAQSLRAVIAAGHDVCGVFTREDKPVGRKQILTAPPVKQVALEHGIPVWQPKTLRDGSADEILSLLAPELIVVVAYGRILPLSVLQLPKYGCINLHVSLLPKYRGSAPVQWSVLNGDKETGVTIMQLDEGVDTGDILQVAPVSIGENETSGELFDRISELGAKTLCDTIELIAKGEVTPVPQNHAEATQAPMLTKEMGAFDFTKDARTLHNHIRGMNPWPVASFVCGEKRVKVLRSAIREENGEPGTVVSLKPLVVACGEGALCLEEVVPEGSRPMSGEVWAMGRRFAIGDRIE